MNGNALPKLLALESEVPAELFERPDAEIPDSLENRVEGSKPGPWEDVARLVESAEDESDGTLAPILRRELQIDRRTACDARVWRYTSIWHLRPYVFSRWGRPDGSVKPYRLMGGLTRNAVARLWWMVEMLVADGEDASHQVELALGSTERFKLWLLDFNSFHGRPWLARSVVDRLHENGNPPDKEVDAFFGALGRLSNVWAIDLFEKEPDTVLAEVDVEVERRSPALQSG